MPSITIAAIQQAMRLHPTEDDFQTGIERFMRLAKNKEADLVVFPELCGLMLAGPFYSGLRGRLLKQSVTSTEKSQPFVSRVRKRVMGTLAGTAAGMLGGVSQALPGAIKEQSDVLRESYLRIFSEAARNHSAYVVGGSIYLEDDDGKVRNLSALFAPDGELMGWQAKLNLNKLDRKFCVAGKSYQAFETDFGRIGILVGSEVLFPETTRLLAFSGVEVLVNPLACTRLSTAGKMRMAMLARVQENQIFGVQSYLVGPNPLGYEEEGKFRGRSTLFAPLEITRRNSGVLAEIGTQEGEGFVTTSCDMDALHQLWLNPDIAVRRDIEMAVYGELVPPVYRAGRTISEAAVADQQTSLAALPSPIPEEQEAIATFLEYTTPEDIAPEDTATADDTPQGISPLREEQDIPVEADANTV